MGLTYFDKGKLTLAGIEPFCSNSELNHFITTAMGREAISLFGGLNLGFLSGDTKEQVMQNYKTLEFETGLSAHQIILPNQTHTSTIQVVDAAFLAFEKEQQEHYLLNCDGLLTSEADICIGVLTADCAPVVFYDPVQKVVGVVHAGWRGTAGNICGKMVSRMKHEYSCEPYDILVGIGPCISIKNYEVAPDFLSEFKHLFTQQERLIITAVFHEKHYFDLVKANEILLKRSGIKKESIYKSDICTFDSSQFYSYRKAGGVTGRFLTCIGVK